MAKKLGFINELLPSQKLYDYCLVFGSTIEAMEARLTYLVEMWKRGLRFRSLSFLTGERPLSSAIEESAPHLRTESELVHFSGKRVLFLWS